MKTSRNSDSEENLAQLEGRRLELQTALDAAKSQAERNRLGQFATPPALAREMLAFVRRLTNSEAIRFLDPAFGTGAFYYALLASVSGERIVAAEGYEIDRHYSAPAQGVWKGTRLVLHAADFTKAGPPSAEEERFNLIICNPPYVRHHHIAADQKERLREACRHICGGRIDGLSGLYCYFIVLCHEWLAEDGLGVWLVPSEFMDVNYDLWIKRYLSERVTLLRIHRFDPNEVQFGDALVSSAVVFFRKKSPPSLHQVIFSFGGNLERPGLEKKTPLSVLIHEKKWTRFPATQQRADSGYVLGDLFSIKRGLATGDNSYFILSAERVPRIRPAAKVSKADFA